jgi:hypothetical protein
MFVIKQHVQYIEIKVPTLRFRKCTSRVQCLAVRTNSAVNIQMSLITADALESLGIMFDALS